MKNKLIQMIAVIILIVIVLLNFSTTLSLAALNDKYCNGYRIVKRYDDQDQAVYWITGKLVWKTTEMKFPAIADDNIPITAIY